MEYYQVLQLLQLTHYLKKIPIVKKINAKLIQNGIELNIQIAFPGKYLTDKVKDAFFKKG